MKRDLYIIVAVLMVCCLSVALAFFRVTFVLFYKPAIYVVLALVSFLFLKERKFLLTAALIVTSGVIIDFLLTKDASPDIVWLSMISIIIVLGGVAVISGIDAPPELTGRKDEELCDLVEHLSECAIAIDRDGLVIYFNQRAQMLLGASNLLSGTLFRRLLSERYRSAFEESLSSLQGERAGQDRKLPTSVHVLRSDGREISVDLMMSGFHSRDGMAVLVVLTPSQELPEQLTTQFEQLQDYSEQLELEVQQRTEELHDAIRSLRAVNETLVREIEEREITEVRLRRSQVLLHAIASNFPDGAIAVLDRNLCSIFLEGQCLQELGIDAEQHLGQRLFASLNSPSVSLGIDRLKEVFLSKRISFEVSVRDSFYEVIGIPLVDRDRVVSEALVVVRNITRFRTSEESLLRSLDREKQLNLLKSRFVSAVSHEFRTPLSTILSSTFLLENYSGKEGEVHRKNHVNRIKRSVNSLTELLEDFLSLEKLERGNVKVIPTEFYVQEYLAELLSGLNTTKRPDQVLRLNLEGPDKLVSLDKGIFTNILNSLMSNAIKYSEDDGVIDVMAHVDENVLNLAVSDRGIGIPQDEQQFIFARFFRALNAVNIQGTGLGLTLTKRYVDLLGGKISFESVCGEGTTFTVRLPVEIES